MHSGRDMLQNTPKHHFGSNGSNWVCSCESICWNFANLKQCISVPKRTRFSTFCMHSSSEMLQITPKDHFGSNGGYWVCSCENVRRNFGTPKQCILVPKRTSFSSSCMNPGSEILQNTLRHHFGSNGGY